MEGSLGPGAHLHAAPTTCVFVSQICKHDMGYAAPTTTNWTPLQNPYGPPKMIGFQFWFPEALRTPSANWSLLGPQLDGPGWDGPQKVCGCELLAAAGLQVLSEGPLPLDDAGRSLVLYRGRVVVAPQTQIQGPCLGGLRCNRRVKPGSLHDCGIAPGPKVLTWFTSTGLPGSKPFQDPNFRDAPAPSPGFCLREELPRPVPTGCLYIVAADDESRPGTLRRTVYAAFTLVFLGLQIDKTSKKHTQNKQNKKKGKI